jgi:hypothetical protein
MDFEEMFLLHIPYILSRSLAQKIETVRTTFIAGTAYSCTDFWHRNRGAFPGLFRRIFVEESLR